ncbi:MAG TPA: hypothetical protein VIH57_21405 [Bacteroidales bacterium]
MLCKSFHSLSPAGVMLCGIFLMLVSCAKKAEPKDEQIAVATSEASNSKDSVYSSIQGNVSFAQLGTNPNSVILTGLADHRLVTIYKTRIEEKHSGWNSSSLMKSGYDDGTETGREEHFMPGIDILYGYNLLNIAHYDLKTEKLNFLFHHPVLVKTLYYPSFNQDSLNKKPINRDYYLLSVYDEDTNKDSFINRKDLRRFYYFDAGSNVKIQLIPPDYGVIRSQYDSQNDAMYIFARQDVNKNGTCDVNEPVHIFWVNLKSPLVAKKIY